MRTKGLWDSRVEASKNYEQTESKEERFLYYLEKQIRTSEAFVVSEVEMMNFISHEYNKDFFYSQVGAAQALRDVYAVYTQLFGIDKYNDTATGNKPTEEGNKK